MKRLIITLVLSSILLCTGCTSDAPQAVAQQYIDALKEGDYEEALSLMHFDVAEEDRADLVNYLADSYKRSIRLNGGIKSITIKSDSVLEKDARVDVVECTTYNNGVEAEYVLHLIKLDGEWVIDTKY